MICDTSLYRHYRHALPPYRLSTYPTTPLSIQKPFYTHLRRCYALPTSRRHILVLDGTACAVYSHSFQPHTSQLKEIRQWERNHPTPCHILPSFPHAYLTSELCGRTISTDLCYSRTYADSQAHTMARSSTGSTYTGLMTPFIRRASSASAIGTRSSRLSVMRRINSIAVIAHIAHTACAYTYDTYAAYDAPAAIEDCPGKKLYITIWDKKLYITIHAKGSGHILTATVAIPYSIGYNDYTQ